MKGLYPEFKIVYEKTGARLIVAARGTPAVLGLDVRDVNT